MLQTSCSDSSPITEHEYVAIACTRLRFRHPCAGGLITLCFSPWRLDLIEASFIDAEPYDFLWNCYVDADARRIYFQMCAVHWMEIAAAITLGVHLTGESAYLPEAERIIRETVQAARWDHKEIANMFRWRRTYPSPS